MVDEPHLTQPSEPEPPRRKLADEIAEAQAALRAVSDRLAELKLIRERQGKQLGAHTRAAIPELWYEAVTLADRLAALSRRLPRYSDLGDP